MTNEKNEVDRRAAPSSSADELPLPKPKAPATEYFSDEPVYSVEEVRAILAADRRARQGEPVECLRCEGRGHHAVMDDAAGRVVSGKCRECGGSGRATIQAATPADAPTTAKNAAVRFDGEDAREQQPDEQELKFLEYWLSFAEEPIGLECCGRGYGECCGEAVPVQRNFPEFIDAMAARHKELCAKSFASGCREGRHVLNDNDSCRAKGTDRAQAGEDAALQELQEVARAVIAHEDDGRTTDAPGHCHQIPGVWDASNKPEIAGKPCEWCATWAKFKRLAIPSLAAQKEGD